MRRTGGESQVGQAQVCFELGAELEQRTRRGQADAPRAASADDRLGGEGIDLPGGLLVRMMLDQRAGDRGQGAFGADHLDPELGHALEPALFADRWARRLVAEEGAFTL